MNPLEDHLHEYLAQLEEEPRPKASLRHVSRLAQQPQNKNFILPGDALMNNQPLSLIHI